MALNKFMHPRNKYRNRKPNFKELAIKNEEFGKHVTQDLSGNVILDFKNPNCLRVLTATLLKEDFGLDVELPLDRLIPTVPQRLNYVHWIEDLVGVPMKEINGIDIGTGASCIYPLLGCALNPFWKFLASEVDDENIHFARKNVQKNKMEKRITVKKVSEDSMLEGLVENEQQYDFCMCNPPFFTDHLEAQGISTSRKVERPDPHSISTASEKERISWGGEFMFVSRMIKESLKLRDQIRVYSSLVGKKITVSMLKDVLKKYEITKYGTTEFCQGKTMRWGIAWTFDETVHFPKSPFQQRKNEKPPLKFDLPRSLPDVKYTVPTLAEYFRTMFEELKIRYKETKCNRSQASYMIVAKENTWSKQRRKRRQQMREMKSVAMETVPSLEHNIGSDADTVQSTVVAKISNMESGLADVHEEMVSVKEEAGDRNKGTLKTSVTEDERCNKSTSEKGSTKDMSNRTSSVTIPSNKDLSNYENVKTCSRIEDSESIHMDNKKHKLLDESDTMDDTPPNKKQKLLDDIVEKNNSNSVYDPASIGHNGGELKFADSVSCDHNPQSSEKYENQPVSMTAAKETKNQSVFTDSAEDAGTNSKEMEKQEIKGKGSPSTSKTDLTVQTEKDDDLDLEGEYLFHGIFNLKTRGDTLYVEMIWLDGQNREYMHQVMQYVKNRFCKPGVKV